MQKGNIYIKRYEQIAKAEAERIIQAVIQSSEEPI